jgi:hypothetical protein
VWPVLAGAVTAVGVFAGITAFGLGVFLLVYAILALFGVVTVWGLSLEEFDVERSSVVRIGLHAALAVVALAGLCQILPRYGLLLAVVIGLTSPAAITVLTRARIRLASRRAPEGKREVLPDKLILDRQFDDIVNRLDESGGFPEA